MTLIIGSARIDENGNLKNGKAGDQTGKEVCTQSYYMHKKGWYVLRPKSVTHANALALAMKQACDNNKIGYDQNERNGVITQLKKYDLLDKIATATECDCSSLVRACIIQAIGKDVGNITTANEASVLEASGLFEAKKSVTGEGMLYNGDILVTKTKGHTVIVVSGRARSTATTSNTSTATKSYLSKGDKGNDAKTMQTMLIAVGYSCGSYGADGDFGSSSDKALRKFQEDYGLTVDGKYGSKSKAKLESVYNRKKSSKPLGTYKVTAKSGLYVREGAGTNYNIVPKNKLTKNAQEHAKSNGALRYGTRVTVKEWKNGFARIPSGWVSGDYLRKV
ncbi:MULTISPECIES: peptidoglycan-binding protein [unclassified Faecalibacillus]|uniref:peptidoglycan-binding protein n=1 Tax=unclassified Faecalibacillus TaxID=2678890 RepID=UPI001D09B31A|nr:MULTISPECIES: peptidoglycan-binding protein [unclassified Faecalibacillus]MCB8540808.1 peptidoglycan-binding protein [Faecalibacillus sp. TM498]MCB8558541.1 peptidoglycan-binding protein [Faecalibacillus sp. TM111]